MSRRYTSGMAGASENFPFSGQAPSRSYRRAGGNDEGPEAGSVAAGSVAGLVVAGRKAGLITAEVAAGLVAAGLVGGAAFGADVVDGLVVAGLVTGPVPAKAGSMIAKPAASLSMTAAASLGSSPGCGTVRT